MYLQKSPLSVRSFTRPVLQTLGLPSLFESAGCSSSAEPPLTTVKIARIKPLRSNLMPICSWRYSLGVRESSPHGRDVLRNGLGPAILRPSSSSNASFLAALQVSQGGPSTVSQLPKVFPIRSLIDITGVMHCSVNTEHLDVAWMICQ